LKCVWLNVTITTDAPIFNCLGNRHVIKDFYSIQELCHNIRPLL